MPKKKSDGQIYALKILEKEKMTQYDIDSSFTEMRVAQNIHHPFIAGLRIAFQSRTKLFLGMNYYAGGDLFHHMSKGPTCRIAPARAKFYTAELILGIHHLHQHNILYRDIKPENVMIDLSGHIALVDFGLAKLHVSNYKGAKTMAGSPQYTAPELLLPKGKRSYGKAADWWSLGILLYEMTLGKSPFFDSNIEQMYRKIQNEDVPFPSRRSISTELMDLLLGLLRKDPRERFGKNISDILTHPYFKGTDWDLLLQKKIKAPWKPKLSSALDVGYVDTEFTNLDVTNEVCSPTERTTRSKSLAFIEKIGITKSSKKVQSRAQDPTFKDFNYFCEDPDLLVKMSTLSQELRPKVCETDKIINGIKDVKIQTTPEKPVVGASESAQITRNGLMKPPFDTKKEAFHAPSNKVVTGVPLAYPVVEATGFPDATGTPLESFLDTLETGLDDLAHIVPRADDSGALQRLDSRELMKTLVFTDAQLVVHAVNDNSTVDEGTPLPYYPPPKPPLFDEDSARGSNSSVTL